MGVYYPSQERGADAVLDHTDQHGGRHVLSSSLPCGHRLPEEVQPAAAAGDDVEAARGILMFVLQGAEPGLSQGQDPVKFIRASRYRSVKAKRMIRSCSRFHLQDIMVE